MAAVIFRGSDDSVMRISLFLALVFVALFWAAQYPSSYPGWPTWMYRRRRLPEFAHVGQALINPGRRRLVAPKPILKSCIDSVR